MTSIDDPIVVVPDSFNYITDDATALRQNIEANRDLHTMEDPLGTPDGVLMTGFYDNFDYKVQEFWEEEFGDSY